MVFLWAIANDRIIETSLGYYMNPLMFIAAGVLLLGEKLSRTQLIAMAMAAIGVLILIVDSGVFPLSAFFLAASFTAYGLLHKRTPVGAVPSLFIETLVLLAPAVFYLVYLAQSGALYFGNASLGLNILLILAGPVTVIPLTLFAIAARRVPLATIGFLQYIGPTITLFVGLYYGEAFTTAHAICFGFIWSALTLISLESVRNARADK
ncbi:MAG: EamA family transporter RarD [Pseudomonadota bacterium]